MALVLKLRLGEGVWIGDAYFEVTAVDQPTAGCPLPNDFEVVRRQDNKTFRVTDSRRTEVADDVFLSAGVRPQLQVVSIAISAPPAVAIVRDAAARAGGGR